MLGGPFNQCQGLALDKFLGQSDGGCYLTMQGSHDVMVDGAVLLGGASVDCVHGRRQGLLRTYVISLVSVC
jgi:hypothetical protein